MRSVNGSVHASHGASAAWPLSAIRIGPRARRQLGNLQPLMASIAAVGLLHPVVIRPDGTLLAGQRRLEACRALGYTAVPVHIVDTEAVLRAEHDENTVRLDFLPSELVAIAEALWHHEAAEAYQRMLAGTPSGKFPEGVTGETRNKVAQYVGVSGRTLEKATAIVRAAREHPEKYQRLVDQMDQHGKVDPAYKMLKVARAHERTAAKARQAQEQMAAEAQAHFASVCDIRQCSMQELLTSGIHPDVIITDPPYAESHLSLYGELARLATHVPTVATLCGCMFLPDILTAMCASLHYRWLLSYLMGGPSSMVYNRHVHQSGKVVLVFGKVTEATRWLYHDWVKSAAPEKDAHDWGQSVSGMRALVEMLTEPGDLVCDPFLGGGTTAVVCQQLGRRFVGCDVDPEAVRTARERCYASVASSNAPGSPIG